MIKVHPIIPSEYVFDPSGRFALRLVDQNTSLPSKCGITMERLELEMYLATTIAIWARSLN
jgi:hypothetical protein